jgi:hypothetical protein
MTGVSLAGLADRLGIEEVRAFVVALEQGFAKTLYGEKFLPKARVKFEFLTSGVIEEDLEAVNQALSPSIHDVHETGDGLSVTYASENRSAAVLDAVRVQHAVFAELLVRIPDTVLAEALELAASTRLVFLVRECARHAGTFDTVISRARPGAALKNDPNAIKLNLPYATRFRGPRRLVQLLKRVLKPVIPRGSFLYRFGRTQILILQVLTERIKRM